MKKIYILVNHSNLTTILSNILEIIGFLPEIIDENTQAKKNKEEKNTIFTSYYYAKHKPSYLKQFKTIIIFVPSGISFLDTNLELKDNKVIYFNQALTVNNIRKLLSDIKLTNNHY